MSIIIIILFFFLLLLIVIIFLAKQSMLMVARRKAFVRLVASLPTFYLCAANGQCWKTANFPRDIIYCFFFFFAVVFC